MPVPINAHHEHIVSNATAQAMGKTGRFYIIKTAGPEQFDAGVITGISGMTFCALQVINDAVFSEIAFSYAQEDPSGAIVTQSDTTGNPAITGFTVPAGTLFTGVIDSFILDSGVVFAYIS